MQMPKSSKRKGFNYEISISWQPVYNWTYNKDTHVVENKLHSVYLLIKEKLSLASLKNKGSNIFSFFQSLYLYKFVQNQLHVVIRNILT